jgi:tetratricopeptide (TPR) repeat protein
MFRKVIEGFKPLFLIIISFLVFVPAINGGFLNWDDTIYILNNPLLYEGISLESFLNIYQIDQHISLVLFSFLVQIKIFGTDPVFFHFINIIIHVINVLLVYKLSRSFSKSVNVSIVIALLFAIHPMKAETVSWIIQRKDLLYSLFFLTGIVSYIEFHKTRKVLFLILSFVLAYLAILSKIQAFVLPFVFVLTDYYFTSKLSVKSLVLNLSVFIYLFIPIENIYKSLYLFVPVILLNLNVKSYTFIEKLFPVSRIAIVKKTLKWLGLKETGSCFSLFPLFVIYTIIIFLFLYVGFDLSLTNVRQLLYVLIPIFLFSAYCFASSFQKTYRRGFMIIFIFVIIILISIITFYKLDASVLNSDFEFGTRLLLACYSVIFYLYQLLFPFHLNAMHTYPEVAEKLPWMIIISPLFLGVIIGLGYVLLRRITDKLLKRQMLYGIFFFLINITLVLHIIPIDGKVIVADRYTYLASFGFIFFIISGLEYFYKKNRLKIPDLMYKIAIVIVVLVYAFQTSSRSKLWANSKTFWSDVILKKPENHYARYSLGLYYYETNRFDIALEKYNSAINLNSNQYEYFANRGAVNFRLKNIEAAITDFEIALRLNSSDYATYFNRGVLHIYQKSFVDAKNDFEKALKLKPDYIQAREKLDEVNKIMNVLNDDKSEAVRVPTASKQYNSQGVELAMKGDLQAAILDFEYAIKLDSLNLNALRNRGNAYAALKMFEKAQNDYHKVLSINPNDSGIYLNLANTYHESGNIAKACEYWIRALELGENNAQIMLDRFCDVNKSEAVL